MLIRVGPGLCRMLHPNFRELLFRNCLKNSQRTSRLCVVRGAQRLNEASSLLIMESKRPSFGVYSNFQTVSLGTSMNNVGCSQGVEVKEDVTTMEGISKWLR